ncbi:hypothetical protein BJ508DRAFT_132142 [Ascobolus immersus RN42]|uniref:Uncharacterized protein n=1 Tax=Ascobolus immersus RN42 TaxID=1160509 RepID=A0A3N4IEE1_ASCIM|nr:hypothetical protein BJ508DRAFT_132142 [Ascobolus immersus RN42]
MNTPTSNSAAALPGAPIVSTQPSAPTPVQPANTATVQPTPEIERVATPPPPYPSLEARQIRVPSTVTPLPTAGQPGSSENPPSITTTETTGGQNRNSEQAHPPQPGAPSQRPNGARVSAARANVVRVQRPQAPSLRLLYDQLAEVAAPFQPTLRILPSLPARIRTFFSQLLQFLRYQLPFKGIYETETMAYWIILLSVASYYFGMGRTGKFVKHAAIVAVAAESLRRLSGNGRW